MDAASVGNVRGRKQRLWLGVQERCSLGGVLERRGQLTWAKQLVASVRSASAWGGGRTMQGFSSSMKQGQTEMGRWWQPRPRRSSDGAMQGAPRPAWSDEEDGAAMTRPGGLRRPGWSQPNGPCWRCFGLPSIGPARRRSIGWTGRWPASAWHSRFGHERQIWPSRC